MISAEEAEPKKAFAKPPPDSSLWRKRQEPCQAPPPVAFPFKLPSFALMQQLIENVVQSRYEFRSQTPATSLPPVNSSPLAERIFAELCPGAYTKAVDESVVKLINDLIDKRRRKIVDSGISVEILPDVSSFKLQTPTSPSGFPLGATNSFTQLTGIKLDRYQMAFLEREFVRGGRHVGPVKVGVIASRVKSSESKVRLWFKHRGSKPNRNRKPPSKFLALPPLQFDSPFKLSQTAVLEKEFEANRYPPEEIIFDVAEELGLSVAKVSAWFESRRLFELQLEKRKRALFKTASPENDENAPKLRKTSAKALTEAQIEGLEIAFAKSLDMKKKRAERLGNKLNIPWQRVYVWFRKKRAELEQTKNAAS